MQIVQEISQLLFPSRCLSCHKLSPTICSECLLEWQTFSFTTYLPDLIVQSATLYTTVASKIILKSKENGISTADELLVQVLIGLIESSELNPNQIRMVPIPSNGHSIRRRGRNYMVEIVQQISRQTGIAVLDCLALTGKTRDQSGLNRKQRLENMQGSISMKAMARGELLLIDDVITTGATLKEAARAINSQGFHAQISAITACVAQPLR